MGSVSQQPSAVGLSAGNAVGKTEREGGRSAAAPSLSTTTTALLLTQCFLGNTRSLRGLLALHFSGIPNPMHWAVTFKLLTSLTLGNQPLTLKEVLTSTLQHYPMLDAAAQDVEAARMDLLTARGGFDPELKARALSIPTGPYAYNRVETTLQQPTPLWGTSVFAGWRRGWGDIPIYYGNYETWTLGEIRAGINVPLWRNGATDRRRTSLQKSTIGVAGSELALRQAELDATKTASHKYWDWVAAGRKRAIAKALLAISEQRDSQLGTRVRRGDLPALERVDNQRTLLQRQAQVITSERVLAQTALELSLFLRSPQGEPLKVEEDRLPAGFPPPSPPTKERSSEPLPLDDVLARRPDVLRLINTREQQRLEARLAENQQAPQIDLTVAAAKDLGTGPSKLGKPELELGLGVDIPLLNRPARGRAGAASVAIAKTDAQLRLQQERARIEVRDARIALQTAGERVELARRELAAARELANGERIRFSHGDSSLLIVNLREQASAEAEIREVDMLAEYFKAAATLRAAMALPPFSDESPWAQ